MQLHICRQLKPYQAFYHERGIDTLSFAVGPNHVLSPASAMEQMRNVLNEIKKRECVPDLVFHHFSVGGFLFGQMIRLIEKDNAKYGHIQKSIKAQIFDSPPDFNGIATGVSHSMGIEGVLRKVIQYSIEGYLKLTENNVGVEHRY